MSNNDQVKQFDAFEAEQRAQAVDLGFTAEELAVADRDIAEERKNVVSGVKTAEDAEFDVGVQISEDLDDLQS